MQEFSVQTSSFDAAVRARSRRHRQRGHQIRHQRFHGTAFEFLRNYELNAANFFSGRERLKRNQFGGALGGPIRKDRTFFFVVLPGHAHSFGDSRGGRVPLPARR